MRRLCQRARTDFPVVTADGGVRSECRGIEVSSTGIVLDRGHAIQPRHQRVFLDLEFRVPGRKRVVHAVARPIWAAGSFQALKFIVLSDADRLTLAEHVDQMLN